MYFGVNALGENNDEIKENANVANLEEAAKPSSDSGITCTGTMIAHMIKFEHPDQKYKQTGSWAETILREYDNIIDNERDSGNSRTNYVNAIINSYNTGKLLRVINTKLKEDGTRIHIYEIPAKFSYENLRDFNFVVSFLLDNVYTEDALSSIEGNKHNINIPPEVYARCKGH